MQKTGFFQHGYEIPWLLSNLSTYVYSFLSDFQENLHKNNLMAKGGGMNLKILNFVIKGREKIWIKISVATVIAEYGKIVEDKSA